MSKCVVDRGEIEIHFARGFGGKVACLEIDDDEAAQLQVIEEEIEVEVLIANVQVNLPSDQCKSRAQFEEKFLDVVDEAEFDGAFVPGTGRPALRLPYQEVGQ